MLDWKGEWDSHTGLAEFAYNNSYHASIGMAPYEALYRKPCRSPVYWDEVGERMLDSPIVLQHYTQQVQMIRERLRTAQSRQKCYADRRRRELVFSTGDMVFVKVSPIKSVFWFGKKGKLSPRLVGPFEILDRIGEAAYRVAQIHNVFHVSMLRRYVHDPSHIIHYDDVDIQKDLTFEERPVAIVDRRDQVLRSKTISIVKVCWQHHGINEYTWSLSLMLGINTLTCILTNLCNRNFADEIILRRVGCNEKKKFVLVRAGSGPDPDHRLSLSFKTARQAGGGLRNPLTASRPLVSSRLSLSLIHRHRRRRLSTARRHRHRRPLLSFRRVSFRRASSENPLVRHRFPFPLFFPLSFFSLSLTSLCGHGRGQTPLPVPPFSRGGARQPPSLLPLW